MRKAVILSHLLDKYENSKHLMEPGMSNRRVMLRVGAGKKEFPEYDYQDASVRDAYNAAAIALEEDGLVSTEWVKGRPVLACVTLNLEKVMDCYCLAGRIHPKELARKVSSLVKERLADTSTDWVISWRNAICDDAQREFRVPSYCKGDFSALEDLLTAFCMYDSLCGETITMRAFSSKCYHDTKYFENHVRERFLRIAQKYDVGLAQVCGQENLGIRDQLAYLGIYARPELYELAGDGIIRTENGLLDMHSAGVYGLALPSTGVDFITSIDLTNVDKVTFIENKTSYDEYILSELRSNELAVYHGGFLSPQKKKLFKKIGAAIHPGCNVSFWADIDLGGFQMYTQLQTIFPAVHPMRMSGDEVEKYHQYGLKRSASYLESIMTARDDKMYLLFGDAIEKILKYGVTIEQEAFLAKH